VKKREGVALGEKVRQILSLGEIKFQPFCSLSTLSPTLPKQDQLLNREEAQPMKKKTETDDVLELSKDFAAILKGISDVLSNHEKRIHALENPKATQTNTIKDKSGEGEQK
jgi:hypothetical protein